MAISSTCLGLDGAVGGSAGKIISPGSDAVDMLASWLWSTAMFPLTVSRSTWPS